ncbi:hypothetical protein HHI36_020914 [Cryptolaemus montrouzieri]|uniref:Uncharacterized protein n=1 Tax=Cryptolaemus montrouzieri TaxID=559131 RepID=A0ABD2NBZ5_9CUCU
MRYNPTFPFVFRFYFVLKLNRRLCKPQKHLNDIRYFKFHQKIIDEKKFMSIVVLLNGNIEASFFPPSFFNTSRIVKKTRISVFYFENNLLRLNNECIFAK